MISRIVEQNLKRRGASADEIRATAFFVRVGIWVVISGVAAIVGLAITFSSDPMVASWGWQILRVGFLLVFLLMDIGIAQVARWAWAKNRTMAGWLVLGVFLLGTAGVVAALFLAIRDVAEVLYYVMAALGLVAVVVSILEDRRRKTQPASPKDSKGFG